jgi:hypothetical protein
MDRQDLFDALSVRFSDVTSRQEVLRLLWRLGLAMLVFGVFPWRVMAQVGGESELVKGCKLPGQRCHGKNKCCAKKCTSNHRCGCINKGHVSQMDTPLGPVPAKAFCCSNKINQRTAECK